MVRTYAVSKPQLIYVPEDSIRSLAFASCHVHIDLTLGCKSNRGHFWRFLGH